ncbi:preprotein translocase subunit SecY [Escherichia coli]|nr:preprotein translocase subunit SecY [Escherichia coli]EFB1451365.1 preprotein translocase subunit SecY [Escherichia coli]
MNFAELRMILFSKVLNTLEKMNALGRSLVIFKIALSRS